MIGGLDLLGRERVEHANGKRGLDLLVRESKMIIKMKTRQLSYKRIEIHSGIPKVFFPRSFTYLVFGVSLKKHDGVKDSYILA